MTKQDKQNTTNVAARMRAVLAGHGISVTHSKAREIAAAALGYRSSNEMDGTETITRRIDYLGTLEAEGHTLALLRDVKADGVYALGTEMMAMIASRRRDQLVGISPYGGLVDLTPLVDEAATAVQTATTAVQTATTVTPRGAMPVTDTRTREAFVIGRVSKNGTTFWDGRAWGELHSAFVHDRMDELLLTSVDGTSRAAWYQLPDVDQNAGGGFEDDEPSERERRALDTVRTKGVDAAAGVRFDEARTVRHVATGERRIIIHARPGPGDAARMLLDEITPTLTAADATAWIDGEGVHVDLPASDVDGAGTTDDWLNAVADLVTPIGDRPRIFARFTPEAWINGNAVEVDHDGRDTRIDVTFELLLMGRDAALELTSSESDHLIEAVRATPWIRHWSGPYTIHAGAGARRYHEGE